MPQYYGQLVVGPAGSGKSTYCKIIQDMAADLKRQVYVINLDPACETFKYQCDIDVKDQINVDDIMEYTNLGPNGGLIYAMEYLIENTDWLETEIQNLGSDDYVLFDCPGQLELYTHLDVMRKVTKSLENLGFSLCSVCLVDSTFLVDDSKFFSGVLMATSCMISLELPHITVLSKCDLVEDKKILKKYLKLDYGKKIVDAGDEEHIQQYHELNGDTDKIDFGKLNDQKELGRDANYMVKDKFNNKYRKLTEKIIGIVNDYNLVSLQPLDINDPETVQDIIYHADNTIQYGELKEPDENAYLEAENKLNAASDTFFNGNMGEM